MNILIVDGLVTAPSAGLYGSCSSSGNCVEWYECRKCYNGTPISRMTPRGQIAARILEDLLAYRSKSAVLNAQSLIRALKQNSSEAASWAEDDAAPLIFDAIARVCAIDEVLLSRDALDNLDRHCPQPHLNWQLEQWAHWKLFKGLLSFLKRDHRTAAAAFEEGLHVIEAVQATQLQDRSRSILRDIELAFNYYLAVTERRLGDYVAAQHHITHSIKYSRSAGLRAYFSIEHARILLSIGHNFGDIEELLFQAEISLREAEEHDANQSDPATKGLLYALQARLCRRREGALGAAEAAINKALSEDGLPPRHRAGFLSDRAHIRTLALRGSSPLDEASRRLEERAILSDIVEAERLYLSECNMRSRPPRLLNNRAFLRIVLGEFVNARDLCQQTLRLARVNAVEQSTAHLLRCMCECLSSDGNADTALREAGLALEVVKGVVHRRKQARAIIWQGRAWLLPPYRAVYRAKKCLELAAQRLATEDLGYIRDEWFELQRAIDTSGTDDVLFVLRRSDLLSEPEIADDKGLWHHLSDQFDEAFVREAGDMVDAGIVNKTKLTGRNVKRFDDLRARIAARDKRSQLPNLQTKDASRD